MTAAAIQSLPGSARDAERLAARLHIPMHEIAVHLFPDGELRVTVGPAARTTILYVPLDRPNDKLVAILLANEALRRQGAERIVLVAPYLCYMRQDTAFHPGEAVSQKVIGHLLADAFDRLVTVQAHLHRTADIASVFPGIEAHNLSAAPAIADALRQENLHPQTVVAGPDAESRPWVCDLAQRLGLTFAVGHKARRGDRTVEIAFDDPASLAGRPVLLVDDIVSSGGTMTACASALKACGAASIDAIITHALFPAEMTQMLISAGLRTIRSTTSVVHPTNVIPLDAILAEALVGEASEIG